MTVQTAQKRINTPRQVLFASLVGTTVEFFDFYIYATAAVLIFPHLFFPASDPASSTLASLATFGIAFLARPIGSALFGHFGDRIGRKKTLVLALSTMGLSTFVIGALPTYQNIGIAAPLLLALCRFGQGIGLGGEWGGAVLLAVENAPPNKRALYGMFPQLGAPIGFLFSGGTFLLLSRCLTDKQFFAFGWRLPFLASAVLVLLGLYVRLTITETPVFQASVKRSEQVSVPILTVLRHHSHTLVAGILVCLADLRSLLPDDGLCALLGNYRSPLQPRNLPAHPALRHPLLRAHHSHLRVAGRTRPASLSCSESQRSSPSLALCSRRSSPPASPESSVMMALGLALMGLTYGPLGTLVSELFPTPVRYTGSSLAFSMAGILGASLAPYIATWLAKNYGLQYVGYYLTGSAVLSFIGLLLIRETKDDDLTVSRT